MIKKPMRMCIACRERKPKDQLLRFVSHDHQIVLDNQKQLDGRGFYLCNKIECVDLMKKKKILNKVLSRMVTEQEYEAMKEYVHEKK